MNAAIRRCGCKSLFTFGAYRFQSHNAASYNPENVRDRLLAEVKQAMKNKDNVSATVFRSALSEVQAADKAAAEKVASSAIMTILRKATQRRNDAALQFMQASRPDLAERERREADILSALLPPLLSEDEIDRVLRDIIAAEAPGSDLSKNTGKIFKAFYSKVEKSSVEPSLVKRRMEMLISSVQ